MASPASSPRRPRGDSRRRRRGGGAVGGGVIPIEPEEAPRPWQTPWLSSRGWMPLFVGEEEVVVKMVAVISSRWRHARAGSERLRESGSGEEKDAAMTTRHWRCCHVVGGRRTTQRGEWGRRGKRKVSWRRTTRRKGGGGQREASGRRTTVQHNKRVGAHC